MGIARRIRSALSVVVAGLALGATPAPAFDAMGYMSLPDCEPQTGERPYVCDVGLPRPLTPIEFRRTITRNGAVRRLVERIGIPDYAELQKVAVDSPWRPEEIRLYYLDFDRMYSFGRAMILDEPAVSVLRYQGPIPSGRGPIR